jgi:hypothetical protein
LCLAVTFAVLSVLAVRSCHPERSGYHDARQPAGSR